LSSANPGISISTRPYLRKPHQIPFVVTIYLIPTHPLISYREPFTLPEVARPGSTSRRGHRVHSRAPAGYVVDVEYGLGEDHPAPECAFSAAQVHIYEGGERSWSTEQELAYTSLIRCQYPFTTCTGVQPFFEVISTALSCIIAIRVHLGACPSSTVQGQGPLSNGGTRWSTRRADGGQLWP